MFIFYKVVAAAQTPHHRPFNPTQALDHFANKAGELSTYIKSLESTLRQQDNIIQLTRTEIVKLGIENAALMKRLSKDTSLVLKKEIEIEIRQLKAELKNAKSDLKSSQSESRKETQANERLQAELRELQASLKAEKETTAASIKTNDLLTVELRAAQTALESERQKFIKEKKPLEHQIHSLTESLAIQRSTEKTNKELREEIDALKTEATGNSTFKTQLLQKCKEQRSTIETFQKQVAEQDKTMNSLHLKNVCLEQNYQAKVAELKQGIRDLQAQLAEVTTLYPPPASPEGASADSDAAASIRKEPFEILNTLGFRRSQIPSSDVLGAKP